MSGAICSYLAYGGPWVAFSGVWVANIPLCSEAASLISFIVSLIPSIHFLNHPILILFPPFLPWTCHLSVLASCFVLPMSSSPTLFLFSPLLFHSLLSIVHLPLAPAFPITGEIRKPHNTRYFIRWAVAIGASGHAVAMQGFSRCCVLFVYNSMSWPASLRPHQASSWPLVGPLFGLFLSASWASFWPLLGR